MSTVLNIPLGMIDTAPQVRTKFNDKSIAELAADIQAHGVLQPLVVQAKGARFQLLIGERRLRACQLIQAETVPAILATISAELAEEVQLMENIQREDLCNKDLAQAIHGLWKKHGSIAEVGRRVHKSPSWVSKRLALALEVGPATTLLLDANVKDVELIYNFKKLEKINPKKALQLAPEVIAGTLGREEINDWILETDGAADDEASNASQDKPEGEPEENDPLALAKYNLALAFRALQRIDDLPLKDAIYKQRDMMKAIARDALVLIGDDCLA